MAQMMRAAVLHASGEAPTLTLEEMPIPEPGPGQVVVRIIASGICYTDLHIMHGDWPGKPSLPLILGHEGAGYITALGPGVTTLKQGERVGIPWLSSSCGLCDYCLTGRENLCPHQQNTGFSVHGTHAEYALAQAAYVVRLPNNLDYFEAAPLLCAGVTSYTALKEAEVQAGQWVVIVGVGGLGHMAIQYARAMGIHVAALDINDEKLSLAHELGAEVTINTRYQNPVARIQHLISGAHAIIITATTADAFEKEIGMLRNGGTCVLLGLPPGGFSVPIFDVVLHHFTLRGSIVGARKDLQDALQFASEGKVKAITDIYPLTDIQNVLTQLAQGHIHGRAVLQIA